jgi:hypothetical protein
VSGPLRKVREPADAHGGVVDSRGRSDVEGDTTAMRTALAPLPLGAALLGGRGEGCG